MKCSRDIPTLPMPVIRLFHTEEKALRYLGKNGYCGGILSPADAQTWTNREMYEAVVLFGNPTGDIAKDAALMAHEATHIAVFAFNVIGEDNAAEEELCYVVQAITRALCEMHFKWSRKRDRRDKRKV